MKKLSIFLQVIITTLSISSTVNAACGSAGSIFPQLTVFVDAMDIGTCSCNGAGNNYDYYVADQFCGPDALAQARAANGSSTTTVYKGTALGCPGNIDCGYVYKTSNSYIENTLSCPWPPPREDTYVHQCIKVPVYLFCNCVDCSEPEDCYALLKTFVCPDGTAVGMEYQACHCLEAVPTSQPMRCGNAYLMTAMENAEHDGTITEYTSFNCVHSEEQILYWCSQLSQDCGDPDPCPGDQDCDGVPDEIDQCEDTPFGTLVNQFGCPLPSELDTDGDGIPDDQDDCPDSAPGDVVGPDGCARPNDQPPEGQPDGDNDNPLLSTIVDWLKKVSGNTDGMEGQLSKIDHSLNEIENSVKDNSAHELSSTHESAKTEYDNALSDGLEALEEDPSQVDHDGDGILDHEKYEILKEKNDFYEMITEVIATNPISDALNGIQLNASGNCSINVSLLGKNVALTLCPWSSEMSAFGQILIMLVSFHAVIIVFRR